MSAVSPVPRAGGNIGDEIMGYCQKCGSQVQGTFCPSCGQGVQEDIQQPSPPTEKKSHAVAIGAVIIIATIIIGIAAGAYIMGNNEIGENGIVLTVRDSGVDAEYGDIFVEITMINNGDETANTNYLNFKVVNPNGVAYVSYDESEDAPNSISAGGSGSWTIYFDCPYGEYDTLIFEDTNHYIEIDI